MTKLVYDDLLRRNLSHTHTTEYGALYLHKAGDVATGSIQFPETSAQGNYLIASINAGSTKIDQDVSLPDQSGHTGQYLVSNGTIADWQTLVQSVDWTITGNAGTVAGTNFMGTTDNIDVVFKRNNIESMRLQGVGSVSVGGGSVTGSYSMAIGGGSVTSNYSMGIGYSPYATGYCSFCQGEYSTPSTNGGAIKDFAFVTGDRAGADHFGEFARTSIRTPYGADAQVQFSFLTAHATTTDATPTELSLNYNPDQYITVPLKTSYFFEITLTGRETVTGYDKTYKFFGVASRYNDGNLYIVDLVTDLFTSYGVGGSATVDVNNTNKHLRVMVTGAVGQTIRWFAKIELTKTQIL